MKKKILAALLATIMVFSFTACGSKDDGVFVLSEDKLEDYITLTEDFDVFNVEIDPINVTDDDIKFALFGGDGEITDAMYDEVKQFAAFIKQREAEKKE